MRIAAHWTGRGFDGAGNLHSYTVEVYRDYDGKYLYATDHSLLYRVSETYQLASERTHSYTTVHNVARPGDGSTLRTYDVNNQLVQYSDSKDAGKNRYFANDAQGQVLMAIQGNFDGDDGRLSVDEAFDNAVARTGNLVKAQYFFSANGQTIGSFGQLQDGEGDFRANFDVNYTAVSSTYPSSVPQEVVAQTGETLRMLAARVLGDASLWYVIAEENGLSDPDAALEAGTQLRIPNTVLSLSNTAATFKPFEVSAALGDTTPTQPPIMPKKKHGFLRMLVVVIVAIIVTFYTAGVLSGAAASGVGAGGAGATAGGIGAGFGANVAAGAAALTTGTAGFGTAALSAAAGSIVSQGAGIALGVQDEFSWKAVGAAALTAGALQGAGVAGQFGSNASFGQVALQGAFNSAVNQGSNILLGLQDSFSWREVALSAVSAGVSAEVGQIGAEQFGITNRSARLMVEGTTSLQMRRALGGRVDTTSVLADVFGNAIGNSIVDRMAPLGGGASADGVPSKNAASSDRDTGTSPQFDALTEVLNELAAQNQADFDQVLQRDLRQQQLQQSLERDIASGLYSNAEFPANLPMPTLEFQWEPASTISRQARLDQDLMNQAIAGRVGTSQFNRPIQNAFDAQLIDALTPKAGVDPRTGLRAGPTPENAIALGYESRPDYYSHFTAEMWQWDGKVGGQLGNLLGLDDARAGAWHYQQAANLSSSLPVLPAAGGYSLGARFVASQLVKQPVLELGMTELLKGMGTSGTMSAVIYGLVNQGDSTPAGTAVAFGSGVLGAGLVKQGMNAWAGLPNTAFPVSWSNAVTQAIGSAYGFSAFGIWNLSNATASGESWWTRPIIAPASPEQPQGR